MTVRVLIVDDQPIVRRGLKTLLAGSPELEVVDEGSDGVEAVEKAQRFAPDVVLLDISMPRMNGLDACRRIRALAPNCEILIVTQYDSPEVEQNVISAGARGYVLKSRAGRDLLAAVNAVSRHQPFLTHH
jgi:DNA-binding NarL/FixJ family response regulator